MPPPAQTHRPRMAAHNGPPCTAATVRSAVHSLFDSNQTSLAFAGARRLPWMVGTANAPMPVSRRPKPNMDTAAATEPAARSSPAAAAAAAAAPAPPPAPAGQHNGSHQIAATTSTPAPVPAPTPPATATTTSSSCSADLSAGPSQHHPAPSNQQCCNDAPEGSTCPPAHARPPSSTTSTAHPSHVSSEPAPPTHHSPPFLGSRFAPILPSPVSSGEPSPPASAATPAPLDDSTAPQLDSASAYISPSPLMPPSSSQSWPAPSPCGGQHDRAAAAPHLQPRDSAVAHDPIAAAPAQDSPRLDPLPPSAAASSGTKRAAPAPTVTPNHPQDAHHSAKRGRVDRGQSQACPPANSAPGTPDPPFLEWLLHIQRRYRGFGGDTGPYLERSRCRLLADACSKLDLVYLLLHQLFCLWSLDKEAAYSCLEAGPKYIDSAFQLLSFPLRNNSDLSADASRWFSSFPLGRDVSEWKQNPHPQLSQALSRVLGFVNNFYSGWSALFGRLEGRKYPLLVWEMEEILKCSSPVLQATLFTSSRRMIGIADNAPMHQLYQLFACDCKNESRVDIDMYEVRRMRSSIIERYKHLLPQLTYPQPAQPGHLAAATAAAGPPPVLRPTHVSGGLAHPHRTLGTTGAPMRLRQRAVAQSQGPVVFPFAQPVGGAATPFAVPAASERSRLGFQHEAGPVSVAWPAFPFAGAPAPGPGPGHVWQPNPALAHQQLYPSQVVPQQSAGGLPQTAAYPAPQGAQMTAGQPTAAAWAGTPWAPGPGSHHRDLHAGRSVMSHAQQQPAVVVQHQVLPSQLPAASPQSHHLSAARQALPSVHQARASPIPRAAQSQHSVAPLADAEFPRSEHDWTSVRAGLHLVHLRSPRRAPVESDKTQYFQFVERFAVEPTELTPRRGLRSLRFSLTQAQLDSVVSVPPGLGVATFSSGSTRYRLRVCKQYRGAATMKGTAWAVSPTFWPPHIFLELNGEPVYPRRKQHSHHDLPIELGGLLRCGENLVRISLPVNAANDGGGSAYFVAVEMVSICDFSTVWDKVAASEHFCLDDTRNELWRRLRRTDSDDVIVQDGTLRVGVTDPFSSSLYATPVRGLDCKHLECFDLKIWLQTRRGKPSKYPGEPSIADGWKCPICGLDARPVSLRVDDYFAGVRDQLIARGSGDTKYILVKADASWAVMEEPQEAQDLKGGGPSGPGAIKDAPKHVDHAPQPKAAASTVITLDDD